MSLVYLMYTTTNIRVSPTELWMKLIKKLTDMWEIRHSHSWYCYGQFI